MGWPAERWQRLKRAFEPIPVGPEDRARVAANVRAALVAAVVGSAAAVAAQVLAGAQRSPAILVALLLACLGCLWLHARGRVFAAATGLLLGILAAVHGLLLNGEGIHDRAALLYPVVILAAAFTLDRRLLAATTLLSLVSALVVTAVAVHLLVADAVRSLAALRDSEQRLAGANRELETRNAELERFTYVVSHDLRSPLVTIRGFLSYIERDARAGDVDRLEVDAGRIRAATDRMGRLLDDVLELSRTGRIDRPYLDLPFEEVVRDACAAAEGRLSARGVRVEMEGPLPVVRGDRQRLVELVQNLLDNAAKFMGDRADPEVRIGAREEGAGAGQVMLYVRDNGIGIDSAHHGRVFELFHRLDPRVEGTGLGLALARRIVETHGGRIWVESPGAGRGSTFCFSLPAAGPVPESGRAPSPGA
jgi:signal transduction histidine kinase